MVASGGELLGPKRRRSDLTDASQAPTDVRCAPTDVSCAPTEVGWVPTDVGWVPQYLKYSNPDRPPTWTMDARTQLHPIHKVWAPRPCRLRSVGASPIGRAQKWAPKRPQRGPATGPGPTIWSVPTGSNAIDPTTDVRNDCQPTNGADNRRTTANRQMERTTDCQLLNGADNRLPTAKWSGLLADECRVDQPKADKGTDSQMTVGVRTGWGKTEG